MAIPYILKEVEAKLNTFPSKAERLNYLENYLFELKKEAAEFTATDEVTLNYLREKTQPDYSKYMNVLNNGGLIYFNSTFNRKTGRYEIHNLDKLIAERHGIEDLNLLLQRLSLENTKADLEGRIELFKALIKKEATKTLPPQPTKTKTDKLNAPVLGLFCHLINNIGIDKRDENESATVYCKRICNKFELPYTERVRQNYNVNQTKKLIKQLTEKVLPLIDNKTKIKVKNYLDNKQPPKQNLYA